jgi:O-antigen ligase
LLKPRLATNRVNVIEAAVPERDHVAQLGAVPNRPVRARILAPMRIRGRITNGWLILIVLVGGVIALADGLTRVPIVESAASWNGPLEYEPYLGAVFFASATFPLMIAYICKARVSLTEGIFLWFVFCTAAYTRDFSYVHWPGVPLFVTNVVLLILFFSVYLSARPRHARRFLPVNILLLLFLGAGALSALRGLWGHQDAVLVLRDSALVVYSIFVLLVQQLFRSWLSIKRLAVWFLLGAALSAMSGLGWFIAAPGERHFIYYGVYVLISLIGILLAIANRLVRPIVGWIFAGLLCLALLLANARSLFISFAVLLFVSLLAGLWGCSTIRFARFVATLVMAAILVGFVSFLSLRTHVGQDFTSRAANELASGVLHSDDDPYWQFRLLAWKEAWRRFERNPLVGEGFGVPFVFELADVDVRPHNTFLTVLYKMGVIGFLPLLGLLVYFFWLVARAVRRNLEIRRVAFLQIAFLAQGAFCCFGAANLMLESPFLASLFWAVMGLGLRMIEMLDFERTLRGYADVR